MASANISPNKKDVKLVELKWISRADRANQSKISPRKYKLRSRKNQSSSPKKPTTTTTDSKQKKIHTFFTVSPKRKLTNNNNNNDTTQKTPAKIKTAELTCAGMYLSPSARFDSLVPKVEDILRARDAEEKFKKIHEIITESSKRFLEGLDNSTNEPPPPPSSPLIQNTPVTVKFKNCKHLSITKITKKFKKDLKYIDNIFYGRVPSERYELFKNDTPLNNGTKNDLRVNETNIAFTQDQLIHIISLFRERYDQGNIYKYSDFYFKVLLPEYCLKIYCDVYKMTPTDALDYLRAVPVKDFVV